jgi:hypothetical protein
MSNNGPERPVAPHPATPTSLAAFVQAVIVTDICAMLEKAARCAIAAALVSGKRERAELLALLKMRSDVLSKWQGIGSNAALFDPDITPHLPFKWTLLYELRLGTREQLLYQIAKGALHVNITRKEIDAIQWDKRGGSISCEPDVSIKPDVSLQSGNAQQMIWCKPCRPSIIPILVTPDNRLKIYVVT